MHFNENDYDYAAITKWKCDGLAWLGLAWLGLAWLEGKVPHLSG